MTQEQYQRALEINERLKELKDVKNEINNRKEHKLTYSYYDCDSFSGSRWSVCSDWVMNGIGELFDKHDLMIREEIDEEIQKLEKEIETL